VTPHNAAKDNGPDPVGGRIAWTTFWQFSHLPHLERMERVIAAVDRSRSSGPAAQNQEVEHTDACPHPHSPCDCGGYVPAVEADRLRTEVDRLWAALQAAQADVEKLEALLNA
jgi:hypothetical protein